MPLTLPTGFVSLMDERFRTEQVKSFVDALLAWYDGRGARRTDQATSAQMPKG